MTSCRYQIGDAFLALGVELYLMAFMAYQAVTEHWGWCIPLIIFSVLLSTGALLNKSARKKEAIQQARAAKQLALGVPPDEVI